MDPYAWQQPTYGPPPPRPVEETFFEQPDGPWWRMPPELQAKTLRCLGRAQLYTTTGKAAHWFRVDDYSRVQGDFREMLWQEDKNTWVPDHQTSFMRLRPMKLPWTIDEVLGRGALRMNDYLTMPRIKQPTYFSRDNLSASRRRRNLFRTRIEGHSRQLRAVIREAGRTSRPFVFAQLPRPEQMAPVDQWIQSMPTQLIKGRLQASLPRPALEPEEEPAFGFSYMMIDTAEDIVIFQRHRLLPSIPSLTYLDQFLISSVYPQMEHQRNIGFEIKLSGFKDFENPYHPQFGNNPAWNPIYWSVVHFPRLETVYLVNYDIKPIGKPPPKSERLFQGQDRSLFQVKWPAPGEYSEWTRREEMLELVARVEKNMVTHWEAWCHTRQTEGVLVNNPEFELAFLPGNYTIGNPPARLPMYRGLTGRWMGRCEGEPNYWSRLAPSRPTPRIKVKLLAVVMNHETENDEDEGEVKAAALYNHGNIYAGVFPQYLR